MIEPWLYPETTPIVRAAIKRRYEILPYIYSLGLESHLTASPPQRWIGWGFEDDPEVWTSQVLKNGEEQFWLGESILVGGVYEAGVKVARVYLPRKVSTNSSNFDYGYVNLNAPFEYHASGQWVAIASEWKESIPLLARIGSAIPVGKDVQTRVPGDDTQASLAVSEVDDYRGVEIFPPKGASHGHVFAHTWFEDDGISIQPRISQYTIHYSSTSEKVIVEFTRNEESGFVPAWSDLDIILHRGDERRVVSKFGEVAYKGKDARGRLVFTLLASSQ